jgi:hypothetical protein
MGLFRRSLAKQLREGPTLLLADDPGDRLLAAVRRFDPRAQRGDGFVELTFLLLNGPIELGPELAGKARLPLGRPFAYVAEHVPVRDTINVVRMINGLAHALDGTVHPAGPDRPDDMWIDPVVSVFSADPIPQEDLLKVVTPHLPGAEITQAAGILYGIEGTGPMSIEHSTLMSYDPERLPPTLLEPRARYECSVLISQYSLPVAPELLRQAGQVALAVAEATGGVPLDVNGFRIGGPEDVHVDA